MPLYKVDIYDKEDWSKFLWMEVWLTNNCTLEEFKIVLCWCIVSYIYWKWKWVLSCSIEKFLSTMLDNFWAYLESSKSFEKEALDNLNIFNKIFKLDIKEIELPDTVEELLK